VVGAGLASRGYMATRSAYEMSANLNFGAHVTFVVFRAWGGRAVGTSVMGQDPGKFLPRAMLEPAKIPPLLGERVVEAIHEHLIPDSRRSSLLEGPAQALHP